MQVIQFQVVSYVQSHPQHGIGHVSEVIENQRLFQLIRKGSHNSLIR